MEKINLMMIFLSMALSMTFAQNFQNDLPLKQPRKLVEYTNETVLLGFDNYTAHIPEGYKNYTLSFYTYFLFKNWDSSLINVIYLNSFTITSKINDTNKNRFDKNFICEYNYSRPAYSGNNKQYYIVRYSCYSDLIESGIPKLINLTTDFENDIYINNSALYKVSPSLEVFKKDLLSLNLKNVKMFEMSDNYDNINNINKNENTLYSIKILANATILNKNQASFKIKGQKEQNGGVDSNNIQLFTNSYGNPKKVPCVGYYKTDTDDEYYYFLESKGSNNLNNAELQYSVCNVTTKDDIFILDFEESQNSTILPDKVESKRNSGGLSTGGIIAIVIPALIVLLGVGALAFFLSRKVSPSPPPMKNIANNTMGVVASSEAVVHK